MSFKRNLPSISALVTFESAMRLKSFTAAARELNVTQAAVSRQIRLLEEDFGLSLFLRGHRRVEPTLAGAVLGTELNQALDRIKDAVDALRRSRDVQTLTVGATLAFSYFWLLPRLPTFREHYPELKIRVISQDEPFDLRSGELDVLLRFGIPPFVDGRAVVAAHDRFFPVCSPSFGHGLETPLAPLELLSLPLIASDVADQSWMTWPDWFERAGIGRRSPPTALRFNHYSDGIAAALAGQGVAIGWDLIVEDLVARGQLMRLGDKFKAVDTYNAVLPLKKPTSAAAEAFIEWIGCRFEECGARADLQVC